MLPTITLGRGAAAGPFYDASGIVQRFPHRRARTIGLAIHHSVSAARWEGPALTMADEIEHLRAIDAQHVDQDFGGFGYQAAAFSSGRCYLMSPDCGDQRAHVAKRNHELAGIVLIGDYSSRVPGYGAILAAARWCYAMRSLTDTGLPILGHGSWALPASPSFCPGDGGREGVTLINRAALALQLRADEELSNVIRDRIRVALAPAFQAADLERLAAQIAYITERRLCG